MQRYRLLAAYNAWANGLIYDAASGLAPEALETDHGAAFGSLIRTLNHVLVADRIWMRRLTGRGETYDRLDLVLHPNLADLRAAREAEDARIAAFVHALSPERLDGPFEYANMAGLRFRQPLWSALDHVFNHQTHHRGQAHVLLGRSGAQPPALDLIYFQREAGFIAPLG